MNYPNSSEKSNHNTSWNKKQGSHQLRKDLVLVKSLYTNRARINRTESTESTELTTQILEKADSRTGKQAHLLP